MHRLNERRTVALTVDEMQRTVWAIDEAIQHGGWGPRELADLRCARAALAAAMSPTEVYS